MQFIEQNKPVLLALLIGLICGYGGFLAGMPLPWMLGPMIGNTVAALFQLPIKGPAKLRPIVIPVIGVMLGSAITPALFADLGPWAATLIALPLVLSATAGASFLIYRRFGQYDAVTAYFSAMPGGLNEMLIQGEEAGGDAKKIALAHAVRILMVIFFVVAFFWAFLGVRTEGTSHWTTVQALTLLDYLILGACAVAGVWAGQWIKLPAAPIFGPMLLSGATHLLGWVTLPPPSLLVIMAQLVMGTVIGCRFVGSTFQEIRGDLLLGMVASLSMLIAAVICAELLTLAGLPLAQAFLAFAPGGLTEMSLLALSMDQDPAYVSTIHLIRITLVIAAAPLVFRVFQR
ncbi:MAG: AbrB family transcriptional regulator [Pseudomonadota bacterium]